MNKKILYITGTRADFGLMESVLKAIENHKELELEIAITGMHLMEKFGKSVDEILDKNYKSHLFNCRYESDDKNSMSKFIGNFISKLSNKINKINPDIILLLGDRSEMLAGAIVGLYNNIVVAQIHGGETTSTVDESARHAITKLTNIHFPATEKSKERILKMGEHEKNIFVCGAPGIDYLIENSNMKKEDLFKELGLDVNKRTALLLQHPVSIEYNNSTKQIKESLEALKESNFQSIIVYPNADAGGRNMIKVIEQYKEFPEFFIFKNIKHSLFVNVIKYVDLIIGNSSSALIEAPFFKVPAINIGTRQKGRERGINVVDADYDKKEILNKINLVLSSKFQNKLKECVNPYGKGNAGKKIANILSKIKINNELLQKKITY